jgi:hypothetical protein
LGLFWECSGEETNKHLKKKRTFQSNSFTILVKHRTMRRIIKKLFFKLEYFVDNGPTSHIFRTVSLTLLILFLIY